MDTMPISSGGQVPPDPPAPVNPAGRERWRDLWLWDTPYLALFLFVPGAVAAMLVFILMPYWGLHALWLFAAEWIGVMLAATYAWVGHRIRKLRAALPRTAGDVA